MPAGSFREKIEKIPISSNKSQLGHTLGRPLLLKRFNHRGHEKGHYSADNQSYSRSRTGRYRCCSQCRPQTKIAIALSNALVSAERIAVLFFEEFEMKPKPFKPEILAGDANYVRDATTGYVWHRSRQRTLYADTDRSKSSIMPISAVFWNSAVLPCNAAMPAYPIRNANRAVCLSDYRIWV